MSDVDIIVPCYNAQETLGATLDSALVQEAVRAIVVVDDGSTDKSLLLAQRYASRITILTGPNQGVANARNRGAASSGAEWLLFLDSDDLLAPETVARRLATAHETDADVVICDWDDFIDGQDITSATLRSLDWTALRTDPQCAIATDVWAPPAAILYRRSLFTRIGGFRTDLPPIEDARLMFDAARCGARFAHAPHVGARYRILQNSLSRADPSRFWTRVLRNGQQIEAAWREDDSFDEARQRAVAGIYNNAARNLFRAAHPDYFVALASLRRLGSPYPLHGRIAEPLARVFGLSATRSLFTLVGRS